MSAKGPQQPPRCFCVCGQCAGSVGCADEAAWSTTPSAANLGGSAVIHSFSRCQVDSGGGSKGKMWGIPWWRRAGEPRLEQWEDEQALPRVLGGETQPASVLGKCSHRQKSRMLIKASYLHATPFKNRLHLNQKHVFSFVLILSSCFLLSPLGLHQPLAEPPG